MDCGHTPCLLAHTVDCSRTVCSVATLQSASQPHSGLWPHSSSLTHHIVDHGHTTVRTVATTQSASQSHSGPWPHSSLLKPTTQWTVAKLGSMGKCQVWNLEPQAYLKAFNTFLESTTSTYVTGSGKRAHLAQVINFQFITLSERTHFVLSDAL